MSERGQLVLIAAVTITVAIIPMAFAYLQLGYDADVESTGDIGDPEGDGRQLLVRAVHDASEPVPAEFDWANRSAAADAVQSDLSSRFEAVETGLVEQGINRAVRYNTSAASAWANSNCPGGPDRQFGPCVVDGGVIVQERANRTHVLGVAVDLATITDRRESTVTWVLVAW